jgi:hypothetical protein
MPPIADPIRLASRENGGDFSANHLSASLLAAPAPEVQRHRIAIRRSEFSLPVKCLLRDGLLDPVNVIAKSLWTACGRHAMIQMIESPS